MSGSSRARLRCGLCGLVLRRQRGEIVRLERMDGRIKIRQDGLKLGCRPLRLEPELKQPVVGLPEKSGGTSRVARWNIDEDWQRGLGPGAGDVEENGLSAIQNPELVSGNSEWEHRVRGAWRGRKGCRVHFSRRGRSGGGGGGGGGGRPARRRAEYDCGEDSAKMHRRNSSNLLRPLRS